MLGMIVQILLAFLSPVERKSTGRHVFVASMGDVHLGIEFVHSENHCDPGLELVRFPDCLAVKADVRFCDPFVEPPLLKERCNLDAENFCDCARTIVLLQLILAPPADPVP
jgi:regulator of sirC expression with transglutaminase-like and TPR domain